MKLKKIVKTILKTIIIIITILTFNLLIFINASKAATKETYKLEAIGPSITLIKYKGEAITAYYVGYAGKMYNYPAYCLDKTKKFITKELSYKVTEEGEINDVTLWRYIVNGYPYKEISELGCKDRDEAYVATQAAIYYYIYDQKIEDYEPIGEAGKRTIEAMKTIIKNAENTEETPITEAIKINKIDSKFKQDNIEKNYASKTYQVNCSLPLEKYEVTLQGLEEDIANLKVTDMENNIKTEFKPNEKFKILIPIEKLKKSTNFQITIQAKVQAKPVIYAIPNDNLYQDFAIPATTEEEIVNETTDEPYPENETTIKIIKQDKETKKRIEGAIFEILDIDKKTIYENLKTNEEGEIVINNMMPGTYYIRETKAKEGYILSSELIKIEVLLNQNIEIYFYNLKEAPPEIKIDEEEPKKIITVNQKEKLPVTGM